MSDKAQAQAKYYCGKLNIKPEHITPTPANTTDQSSNKQPDRKT